MNLKTRGEENQKRRKEASAQKPDESEKGASESRTASRRWGLDPVPQIAAGPSENILWRLATTKRSLNHPFLPLIRKPTSRRRDGGLTSHSRFREAAAGSGSPRPAAACLRGNADGFGAAFQRY